MPSVTEVAERVGLPAYGVGIRHCNLSPGGGVTIDGAPEDNGGLVIRVDNYYSGDARVAPLVNHENWLHIRGGFNDEIEVERRITRRECFELAQHFLAIANKDSNW